MSMKPRTQFVFSFIKPLCDAVMKQPTEINLSSLQETLGHIPEAVITEMQHYIIFPIVSNLRLKLQHKQELQCRLVETMTVALQKSVVSSSDIFSNYQNCLMTLVFDKTQPGMVANAPEELQLAVIRCLTTMMLNVDIATRLKIFQTLQPMLAQTIFVAVHIAKFEKLKALRLSAIDCVTAYTATHDQFTEGYKFIDKQLESAAVLLASSILPGVVAALQDVAVSCDNPGHAVVVSSLNAIHRIVCLVMNNKHTKHRTDITTEDFVKLFQDNTRIVDSGDNKKEIDNDDKPSKPSVQSPDWFAMAGDKLKTVTASLKTLQTHEHDKVRMELAVFASRILVECSRTMQPSISHLLGILILLSEDEREEVSQYCSEQLDLYFHTLPDDVKYKTFDDLGDGFLATIKDLPRILNNIDNSRKLAALNLVYGYLNLLCDEGRPQRLSRMLTIQHTLVSLCRTLVEAVRMDSWIGLMALTNVKYIATEPPSKCSWCKLRHLDDSRAVHRLSEICSLLGDCECSDLVVDQLLDMFQENLLDRKEIVYLLNYIASAPNSNIDLVKRVLDTYTESDVWYLPLDIGISEAPLTSEDTLDISVYNPRSWDKDHVPGLYEGAIETRYTDISYQEPKVKRIRDPNRCATLAEAQNNMLISCALTYGVGLMAARLKNNYQPYMLKTLCMLLERVGSKYEKLHEAGVHATTMVAHACGLRDVTDLIQQNTDYFTYQVTVRLKKAWNSQSALEILAVVMEYSDVGMFRCLYGIMTDVLVQSCDKYHSRDLSVYLQVFLTFLTCVSKWLPIECPNSTSEGRIEDELDIFRSLIDYEKNKMEADRLLNEKDEIVESGEEMFKKHLEEEIEYEEHTDEKVPPPQHITLTVTILKRCLNFIPSKRTQEKLLALQIIEQGLRMLRPYENELLPIVHLVWSPLVARFAEINEPVVVRRAFELLLTMAEVSKDFISSRTVKEVLPNVYKYLRSSSQESYLKDVGSAYRHSQAYKLQVSVLTALPDLVVCLNLDDKNLDDALCCVQTYLNNKQPKPLQELAVIFFKKMLVHDDGATWHHLRKFCNNQCILESNVAGLEVVVGTADCCEDKDYCSNVRLIFKQ